MAYTFSQNWFYTSDLHCAIERNLFDKSKKWKMLEIGSKEGSSATYFSDHMLNHPESSLVCVDPFDSSNPTTPHESGEQHTRTLLLDNISKSKNGNKITLIEKYSADFYPVNSDTFNFIYIDGSHLVEDIAIDFVKCLEILEPGGIMWMDDYLWGDGTSIRDCVDSLYEKNKDKLEIIFKRYQIGFKKV